MYKVCREYPDPHIPCIAVMQGRSAALQSLGAAGDVLSGYVPQHAAPSECKIVYKPDVSAPATLETPVEFVFAKTR